MKRMTKIAIASTLILPVIASAITKNEMMKFSSENLGNTPISKIKIDMKGASSNFYIGDEWVAEVDGKEYMCQKPGLSTFWLGGGCTANPFK